MLCFGRFSSVKTLTLFIFSLGFSSKDAELFPPHAGAPVHAETCGEGKAERSPKGCNPHPCGRGRQIHHHLPGGAAGRDGCQRGPAGTSDPSVFLKYAWFVYSDVGWCLQVR